MYQHVRMKGRLSLGNKQNLSSFRICKICNILEGLTCCNKTKSNLLAIDITNCPKFYEHEIHVINGLSHAHVIMPRGKSSKY